MGVIAEILEWGTQRPAWQQTALQLLYKHGEVSATEVQTLVALAKQEQGLSVDDATAVPLTLAGVASTNAGGPVALLRVGGIVNSNALGRDQSLDFASAGLTLVFGDNGTGKSGYVRILKQVCRSRGERDQVLPNAFVEVAEPTQAAVTYDTGQGEPITFSWTPGTDGPVELNQISILDSKAALVYVDGQQDVAYLPLGLDLFPRLADVCGRVSQSLESEINTERIASDRFTDFPTGTAVATALQLADSATALEALGKLRQVFPEDIKKVELLRAEIATAVAGQSEARAVEMDTRARRVQTILGNLDAAMAVVGSKSETVYVEKRSRALDLAKGAAKAADRTASGFPLRGLGNASWNELWDAARRFAELGAEPRQVFPPLEGALCVLCQQPIGSDAEARLAAFDTFISDSLATSSRTAEAELEALLQGIRENESFQAIDAPTIEELDRESESIGTRTAATLARLAERRTAMVSRASEVPAMPGEIEALRKSLIGFAERTRQRAVDLRAAQDNEVLKVRQADLAELDARIRLGTAWERVEAELARRERIRRLEAARATTTTTGITKKAKELFEAAVTAPLANGFAQNIEALGLGHIPVQFAPAKGRKGMALHRVALAGRLDVENGQVLSEGEARAIAIAGFLAEVQQQESRTTIVFDDPVSSLDLNRREFVANALIGLAARRPVVVFTHDMPFAWQLHEGAKERGVPIEERQLRRTRNEAGIVSTTISGSGLGARKRVGRLKQRAVDLRKMEESDPEEYERQARLLYGELREVWERGVEDVLLQGAVRRFGREVKTQSLGKLHLLREEHINRLDAAMTKCSGLLHGHDQPASLGRPIPSAVEVAADVAECEAWLSDLTKLYNP